MVGKKVEKFLLEYKFGTLPAGGSVVHGSLCKLGKSYRKDAAGYVFHSKALQQCGLFVGMFMAGEFNRHVHVARAWFIAVASILCDIRPRVCFLHCDKFICE